MPQSPFVRRVSSIVLTSFPISWTPGVLSERDVPITHCLPQHNGYTTQEGRAATLRAAILVHSGEIPGNDAAGQWKR